MKEKGRTIDEAGKGEMMAWARRLWLVLALALFGSFIASIPPFYRQLVNQLSGTQAMAGLDPAQRLALLAEVGVSPERYAAYQVAFRASSWLPYFLIGLLLFARRRDDWRRLGMASLFVLGGTLGGSISPPPAPPDSIKTAVALSLSVLANMATPLLFYTFPDGRFVPRWTAWMAAATFPIMALNSFFPGTALDPFGYPWLSALYGVSAISSFLFAPAYRYFRVAGAVQRQQMKWALLGIAATPLAWIGGAVQATLIDAPGTAEALRGQLAYMGWSTGLYLLAPLAIAFAVLRYRLWDIDVIIRRTLTYSALTAVLGLAYLGSVLMLQGVFQALTGEGQSPLVVVLSTLGIAALFGPVRRRVQAGIDRRFYRRRYDAARTLAGFGASMRDDVDLEGLRARLLGVVEETMQPAHASLWVRGREIKDLKELGK
jgi:hypothetical protein